MIPADIAGPSATPVRRLLAFAWTEMRACSAVPLYGRPVRGGGRYVCGA
ncbi:hypothetical protein [Streptomyces tibetensis]